MFIQAFAISVAVCIPICIILIVAIALYGHYTSDYRVRKLTLSNRMELQDLLATLELIIHTEEALYEQYLSTNSDIDLTKINNSELTNIYQELSMRCLKAVSPQFWDMVGLYMTKEAIQTYITQRTLQYLTDKIEG